ncbi:MAG: 6-phosphofructokinase [Anaerolineae bacterium]|nr:6-phosphofructokinase [Anaerolineae bacterium]
MVTTFKRIGVLTSGGDGPGLNACIRAVTRTAISLGLEVMGIERGYTGLVNGEFVPFDARSVGGILNRGGTILGTTRLPEFEEKKVQRTAIRALNQHGVHGLVVIGGNGSSAGALALHQMGFPTISIPGTIDNDVGGTDMAVGVDTTLNTVIDAIDKIKDTASSHQRAFLIEVMGRDCGYLALMSGIAGGAEQILIPEIPTPLEKVAQCLTDAYIKGKTHGIVIVAEGYKPGTQALLRYLEERKEELGFSMRVTVLGHVQRGGAPSAFDRILGTRLGAAATKGLLDGKSGHVTGLIGSKICYTPLEEALVQKQRLDERIYDLAQIMEI